MHNWWPFSSDEQVYLGVSARQLSQQDYDGWMAASDDQPAVTSLTKDQLRAYLKAKNPWRWRRLRGDFKWMQKRLAKLGYNPEDARFLL